MELIYAWVESYSCFKNTGFNFDAMHYFEFDNCNATLKYCHNDNGINLFENFDMNLTAVVGNNGAGKTTLLEFLFNNLCDGGGGVKVKSLYVFKPYNQQVFQIYYCPSPKYQNMYISLECDSKWKSYFEMNGCYIHNRVPLTQINQLDTKRIGIDATKDIHFIYMSSSFENRYYSYIKAGNISDLSTTARIRDNHQIKCEMDFLDPVADLNINYFYSEFNDQIEFITMYDHFEDFIPFNLPSHVIVTFASLSNKWNTISKLIDNEAVSDKLDNIFSISADTPSVIFKDKMLTAILIMLLNDYCYEPSKRPGLQSEIITTINNMTIDKNASSWEMSKKLIYSIQKDLKKAHNKSQIFADQYIEFIEWLEKNSNHIGNMDRIDCDQQIIIPTLDSDDFVGIKCFFNEYSKTATSFEYLQFSWGLSTGESAILSLFSRFFTLSEKSELQDEYNLVVNRDKKNNAIVLIDEADTSLHPEWQQKYIKLLTEFLNDIYKGSRIQLIITTHSPIILSDIPKENVIFLKKTNNTTMVDPPVKHAETFAANISTLFYDSFFLQRGSIGAFAKTKIDDLIARLKPEKNMETKQLEYPILDKKQYNNLSKEITIIGEPIIQRKLFDMLDECLYSNANGTRSHEQQAQILKRRFERAEKEYKNYIGR